MTHVDTLETIIRDLTRDWHTNQDGQLANIIYSLRRATDHLKERA